MIIFIAKSIVFTPALTISGAEQPNESFVYTLDVQKTLFAKFTRATSKRNLSFVSPAIRTICGIGSNIRHAIFDSDVIVV